MIDLTPADPTVLRQQLEAQAAELTDAVQRMADGRQPWNDEVCRAWFVAAGITGADGPLQAAAEQLDGGTVADDLVRLAILVAASARLDVLGARWQARVHDALSDARGRPGAWRHLSEHAVVLSEVVEPDPSTDELLRAVSDAALDAPAPAVSETARAWVATTRRMAGLAAWSSWLESQANTAWDAITGGLDALGRGAVPLAASSGAADALARKVLTSSAEDEVSLAVTPRGLVLEWTGDSEAPGGAMLGDLALPTADDDSLADRAWLVEAPPRTGEHLKLTWADRAMVIPWPPN